MGGVLCEASTTICVTFSWPFSHQHSLVSVLDSLLCKNVKPWTIVFVVIIGRGFRCTFLATLDGNIFVETFNN